MVSLTAMGSIAAGALLVLALGHHAKPLSPRAAPAPNRAPLSNRNGGAVFADNNLIETPEVMRDPQEEWRAAMASGDASADSFVPLTEGFDPTEARDESIVRVAMSRSSLENMGFYLAEGNESEDQQVVADLLVSNDGTPQAIRVVSW